MAFMAAILALNAVEQQQALTHRAEPMRFEDSVEDEMMHLGHFRLDFDGRFASRIGGRFCLRKQ